MNTAAISRDAEPLVRTPVLPEVLELLRLLVSSGPMPSPLPATVPREAVASLREMNLAFWHRNDDNREYLPVYQLGRRVLAALR